MTPMPPAWAMAIAILASVTVSIAEAMTGMFKGIVRVMRERTSTSDGSTSEEPGSSSTSSKVSASRRRPSKFVIIANRTSRHGKHPSSIELALGDSTKRPRFIAPSPHFSHSMRPALRNAGQTYQPSRAPAGRRTVALDRVDEFAVPAVLPLHVHSDEPMGERHQQQRVKDQSEKEARNDQDQVEQRRERLAVEQQAERRHQGGEDIDHGMSAPTRTHNCDVGRPGGFAMIDLARRFPQAPT